MVMNVGMLGCSFKTAKLDVREALVLACRKRLSRFGQLARDYTCVVLSTCNRLEIYFSAPDLAEAHSALLQLLKEEVSVVFEHQLYSYFRTDCLGHLAHVTAGLDSAFIGESQIQRQVKLAYRLAAEYYPLPGCMHYLFQKCLHIGKEVRARHLGELRVMTIPKLLLQIGERHYGDLRTVPLLFVGNSEINRQIIAYFSYKGLTRMSLCSRHHLHSASSVTALPWEALTEWVDFSWVICGTHATGYAIDAPQRNCRTELICDLSLPRIVAPCVAQAGALQLLNMEDLTDQISMHQAQNSKIEKSARASLLDYIERNAQAFALKRAREVLCV